MTADDVLAYLLDTPEAERAALLEGNPEAADILADCARAELAEAEARHADGNAR